MARLTNLDEVLFPVEEHPIFASIQGGRGERRLPVPDKKAIVNATNFRVLGIVGRGYRLVSNRQALEWAFQCCRTVFPETKCREWEAKAIDAPSTAGFCYIDLMHNSTALDFSLVAASGRPDIFGPFIRVTNSYNGQRALSFDIGFFRKVCTNGLILPDTIIQFKLTHSKREIGKQFELEIAHDRLAKLKARFGDYIAVLQNCPVPRDSLEPLVRGVLSLSPPDGAEPDSREARDWETLRAHIVDLCHRYAEELGDNAYSVFNTLTEFASHPPANRLLRRERNSLQRVVGKWVSDFCLQCRQPAFMLTAYLESLTNTEPAGADDRSSPDTQRTGGAAPAGAAGEPGGLRGPGNGDNPLVKPSRLAESDVSGVGGGVGGLPDLGDVFDQAIEEEFGAAEPTQELPSQEESDKAEKTALDAAKDAAKDAGMTLAEISAGLDALFNDANKVSAGAGGDLPTEQKNSEPEHTTHDEAKDAVKSDRR